MSRPASANQTRQEKVAEREAAILSAARDMFRRQGYAKTTIAGIAKQSGVAGGTVYLYFQNKDALARAVLSYFYADLTASAQAGVDALSRADERVGFLATHHLTEVITHRRVLEMLPLLGLSLDSYQQSPLLGLNKTYTAIFDRVVKDGMGQGQIRSDVCLSTLRDIFFGALDYGSRSISLKQGDKLVEDFVADLMRLILPAQTAPEDNAAARMEAVLSKLEAAAKQL